MPPARSRSKGRAPPKALPSLVARSLLFVALVNGGIGLAFLCIFEGNLRNGMEQEESGQGSHWFHALTNGVATEPLDGGADEANAIIIAPHIKGAASHPGDDGPPGPGPLAQAGVDASDRSEPLERADGSEGKSGGWLWKLLWGRADADPSAGSAGKDGNFGSAASAAWGAGTFFQGQANTLSGGRGDAGASAGALPFRWLPVTPRITFGREAAAGGYGPRVDSIISRSLLSTSPVIEVKKRALIRSGKGTRYAHMVTLEAAPGQGARIYSAWQASDHHEGSHDQHIRFASSLDGGNTWSSPKVVARGNSQPIWGPVLHAEPPEPGAALGRLWLFYSHSRHNCSILGRPDWLAPGGDVLAQRSADGGRTWSKPRVLALWSSDDPAGVPLGGSLARDWSEVEQQPLRAMDVLAPAAVARKEAAGKGRGAGGKGAGSGKGKVAAARSKAENAKGSKHKGPVAKDGGGGDHPGAHLAGPTIIVSEVLDGGEDDDVIEDRDGFQQGDRGGWAGVTEGSGQTGDEGEDDIGFGEGDATGLDDWDDDGGNGGGSGKGGKGSHHHRQRLRRHRRRRLLSKAKKSRKVQPASVPAMSSQGQLGEHGQGPELGEGSSAEDLVPGASGGEEERGSISQVEDGDSPQGEDVAVGDGGGAGLDGSLALAGKKAGSGVQVTIDVVDAVGEVSEPSDAGAPSHGGVLRVGKVNKGSNSHWKIAPAAATVPGVAGLAENGIHSTESVNASENGDSAASDSSTGPSSHPTRQPSKQYLRRQQQLLPLQTLDAPMVTANKLAVVTVGPGMRGWRGNEPGQGGRDDPLAPGRVRWMLPFWRESRGRCGNVKNDSIGLLMSDDHGRSWRVEGVVETNATWLVENSVVQVSGAGMLQLLRSKSGHLYESRSADGGFRWTSPQQTSIPNPDSKAHVARLLDGRLALAYNNSTVKGRRTPLVVALSDDGGLTWETLAVLESERNMDFSYPTLAQLPSGMLVVGYTVADVIRPGVIGGRVFKGIRVALLPPAPPRFKVLRGHAAVRSTTLAMNITGGDCLSVLGVPPSIDKGMAPIRVEMEVRVSLISPQTGTAGGAGSSGDGAGGDRAGLGGQEDGDESEGGSDGGGGGQATGWPEVDVEADSPLEGGRLFSFRGPNSGTGVIQASVSLVYNRTRGAPVTVDDGVIHVGDVGPSGDSTGSSNDDSAHAAKSCASMVLEASGMAGGTSSRHAPGVPIQLSTWHTLTLTLRQPREGMAVPVGGGSGGPDREDESCMNAGDRGLGRSGWQVSRSQGNVMVFLADGEEGKESDLGSDTEHVIPRKDWAERAPKGAAAERAKREQMGLALEAALDGVPAGSLAWKQGAGPVSFRLGCGRIKVDPREDDLRVEIRSFQVLRGEGGRCGGGET
eukprot:jgi/Mesvir1/28246/Mv04787-RA.1